MFPWSALEIPHAISLIPLEIPYPISSTRPRFPVWIFSGVAQCKEGVYFFFHFFGWYFIHLDCLLKEEQGVAGEGGEEVCLTDKIRCYRLSVKSYLSTVLKLTV